MKEKEVIDFDRFVKAVREAGLTEDSDTLRDSVAMPLTHTSAVTPQDWDRVQRALVDES